MRAPSSCLENSHEEGIDEGRLERFYFLALWQYRLQRAIGL